VFQICMRSGSALMMCMCVFDSVQRQSKHPPCVRGTLSRHANKAGPASSHAARSYVAPGDEGRACALKVSLAHAHAMKCKGSRSPVAGGGSIALQTRRMKRKSQTYAKEKRPPGTPNVDLIL
jgi:hypothetical protein